MRALPTWNERSPALDVLLQDRESTVLLAVACNAAVPEPTQALARRRAG